MIRNLVQEFSCIDLISKDKILIDDLVDSRHYYSHFMFPKANKHILKGAELYYQTNMLRRLLICCLLDHIGFDKNEINTITSQSKNTYLRNWSGAISNVTFSKLFPSRYSKNTPPPSGKSNPSSVTSLYINHPAIPPIRDSPFPIPPQCNSKRTAVKFQTHCSGIRNSLRCGFLGGVFPQGARKGLEGRLEDDLNADIGFPA